MATRFDETDVVTRAHSQPWCDLGTEVVVLRVRDSSYYRFDGSGRSIWLLLEQPRTLGELVTSLTQEYSGDRTVIGEETRAFLERCTDLGLITLGPSHA